MHHIPDCFNGLASFRGSPLIVSLTRDSGDLWKHFWWIQLLRACVANFPIREGSLFLFHNLLLPLVSVCGHWKFTGATTSSHLTKQDHKVCWSLSQEDPLEKAMASQSSILAWRIPYTEEPGRLQSIGLQRVRHNWRTEHTWAPFETYATQDPKTN